MGKIPKTGIARCLFLLMAMFLSRSTGFCQDTTTTLKLDIPRTGKHLISETNKKVDRLRNSLNTKTARYISVLSRKEERLKRMLLKIDSNAEKSIFSYDPIKQMNMFFGRMKNKDSVSGGGLLAGSYHPYIDSLQGLLKFSAGAAGVIPPEIGNCLKTVGLLESNLVNSDQLKQLLEQRKEQLKRFLIQKGALPPAVKRLYNKYARESYLYGKEIEEIKQSFNDPDKALLTALRVANKTRFFKEFMSRNSFLSQFFNTNSTTGTGVQNVSGLLSRSDLLQSIAGVTGSTGQDLEGILRQSVGSGVGQQVGLLGQLKGKDETIEVPNYEPNTERTKRFAQRLEFGANIQTQRGTSYFPVTSDFAVSIGYRFSRKSIAGFGAAYKLGFGTGIDNIRITGEGVGLRSFIDFKVKGNLFLTGGFEYNYQLPNISQDVLNLPNGWATSGLFGATKSFNVNNKFFKKSRIQLLWDFLAKYQVPQRQQLLFRMGYNF